MAKMRDCKNFKCAYHGESYSGCSCDTIEIGENGNCLNCYIEEAHLELTDEKLQYDELKEIAKRCGYWVGQNKNDKTEKDFDEAIHNLIKFEKEHGIITN
jgi:hypothetical protein